MLDHSYSKMMKYELIVRLRKYLSNAALPQYVHSVVLLALLFLVSNDNTLTLDANRSPMISGITVDLSTLNDLRLTYSPWVKVNILLSY